MMKKLLQISLFLVLPICITFSQQLSIIPVPAEMNQVCSGRFLITERTVLVIDPETEKTAGYLAEYCREMYGLDLKLRSGVSDTQESNHIQLKFVRMMDPGHYSLRISEDGALIEGSEDGLFYGIQSLIQLMPVSGADVKELSIPFVEINDRPRFQYRGMLLDVSRHYFPFDFLKRCVDYAAWHKLNFFHLHLTDDHGWRIEIKQYPELNRIGSWRNGTMTGLWPGTGNDSIRHGGYYTQDQLKELVNYARDRHVTIIPEIEMPGHALAALASYPHLGCTGGPYQVKEVWGWSYDVYCAGKESTFEFLQNVLDEVLDIFPSRYIHVGGDECPKERWQQCDACQNRIEGEGLRDEDELQSYFIKRMEKYLASKERTLIGWDEILEGGIAPGAVVMAWRGDGKQGCLDAVHAGHKVILTPSYGFYLDYPQTSQEDSLAADWGGVTPLRKTYQYEPVNEKITPVEEPLILGGQANIWTEYINNPSKAEYMTFPRLSAVSEVLWSPRESRNWDQFKSRLELQKKRYRLWGIQYNPADPDLE